MKKSVIKPISEAEFDALPVHKKRMVIAKDVIASVIGELYVADAGVYFVPPHKLFDGEPRNPQVADCIPQLKGCHVCAMGSMLISAIKIKNKITVSHLLQGTALCYNSDGQPKASEITKSLFDVVAGYFTPEQLMFIETAFEGSTGGIRVASLLYGYDDTKDDKNLRYMASEWKRMFHDDRDRLIAIMDNIIRNNGTFEPYDFINNLKNYGVV